MHIDWNAFTPWPAVAGGVLIGIAAAMFVLLNGRIAGISGDLHYRSTRASAHRFYRR